MGTESDAQVALRRDVSLSRAADIHIANRVVVALSSALLFRESRFKPFASRQL
jgi:hypothetical protein